MSLHFEPFVHLAGLTHDDALVAWGGFWFRRPEGGSDRWEIVENPDYPQVDRIDRRHSIGVDSEPYGPAVVEVMEEATGEVAARVETSEANHVWVRGLQPLTGYRYRVLVDGEGWAEGSLRDLEADDDGAYRLVPSHRTYDTRFHTFPAPHDHAPLTFAALGDYGIGLLASGGGGRRQARLARAVEAAIDHHDVRLVVTTGDNVYLGDAGTAAGSGQYDDDWYFSFYQPYRHVISRVPVFPAVGNHDSSDTEQSDDREQVARNFFTDLRFASEAEVGRASIGPGLFYRFDYGADVEFVCIDTTLASGLDEYQQYFEAPEHRDFLEEAFPASGHTEGEPFPAWRIPFSHHPTFCAGPSHPNMPAMVEHLVPLFERSGVNLVLAGHEHNFQWSEHHGVTYVLSGAGGKLREEPPTGFDAAHTVAWAARSHALLVRIDGRSAAIEPFTDIGDDGRLSPLPLQRPDGSPGPARIELHSELGPGGT